jgi:hypothetical protein
MSSNTVNKQVPDNFEKIINDMTTDLSTTFPEYSALFEKWTIEAFDTYDSTKKTEEIQYLFEYCVSYYPERFFDILCKNEEIFSETCEKNALFLPGVEFKIFFNCANISETTRNIMWNYLQLVLMSVIGSVHSKDAFGETKHLFDGIDEKFLFEKMNSTMENMGEFFKTMNLKEESASPPQRGEGGEEDEEVETTTPDNTENDIPNIPGMPNINDLYGHLKTLFDGKIGSLAKELTEEISHDMENLFGDGENQPTSTNEIIQNLLKNPEKMSGLIKTVSDKLNNKISKGEISQDELLKEATEILDKMKGMGDSKQFEEMFKNISKMAGMGSNAKFDTNAFQQMSKKSSLREKMKEKLMKKRAMGALEADNKHAPTPAPTETKCTPTNIPNHYKFSIGEDGLNTQDTTPIPTPAPVSNKNKKNKNKSKL